MPKQIGAKIAEFGADLIDADMVDSPVKAREAASFFRREEYEKFNALGDRGLMTGIWLKHSQSCSAGGAGDAVQPRRPHRRQTGELGAILGLEVIRVCQ